MIEKSAYKTRGNECKTKIRRNYCQTGTAPTAGISEQDRFKNQLALMTLQNAQKQTKDKAWAFLHDFVSDTPLAPLIRKHEDKFNVVDFTKDILQHYEKGTSADEFTQYTKFKDTLEKLVPMDSDDPVTDLKNVCILIDNIDAAIQKLPSNNSALSDFDKLLYLRKALLRDPSNRFSQYNTKKQFYSSFQLELIELVSAQLLKDNLAKPVSKMSSSINETNEAANLTSQDSEANAAPIKSLKNRIVDIKRNSTSNDHLNVNGKRVFYDNRDNFSNRGRGQNSRGQTYHQYNNRNNNNFSSNSGSYSNNHYSPTNHSYGQTNNSSYSNNHYSPNNLSYGQTNNNSSMSTNYQQSGNNFQPQRNWNSQSNRNGPSRSYNSYQRSNNASNSNFDSRRSHTSNHHQAHLADTDETVHGNIDEDFNETFHNEEFNETFHTE